MSEPTALGKRTWRLAIGLAALATLSLFTLVALQAAGVCVKERRYLSDRELMAAAVEFQASRLYRNPEGRAWKTMRIEGTSEAAAEFLRLHPDCCTVNRSPDYRGLLDLAFGWNVPEVSVNYERNSSDPGWSSEPFYTQWIAVTTCGEVLKSTKGWGSVTPGFR